MRIFLLCVSVILLVSLSENTFATHLRAGEIQVTRVNCNSLTFKITLVIYVNTIGTSVAVGGENDFLFFGDGNKKVVAETPAVVFDSQLGIGKVVHTVEYTYEKPGRYVISYIEPSRNDGIVNMDASVQASFQIETMILVEDGICNSSPVLLSPPIDRACSKSAFYHNPGGFDADGDSLSYELAVPKKDDTSPVANYRYPNHSSFYTSFAQGNEAGTGAPTLKIDPVTGLFTWDAPGLGGEYAAAIKIREWKKNESGNWYESSYVIRDMQILVNDCDNQKPSLTVLQDICVVAGELVEIPLVATDPDGDYVRVDFFSELIEKDGFQYQFNPESNVGNFSPSPYELTFTLETSCAMVRSKPYILTAKITDRSSRSPSLAQYYTIRISVIAPPPEITSVEVNPVSKQVSLRWTVPSCDNIQSYQVWRRTSSIEYNETTCAKGMPAFLRYDLLALVPGTLKNYTDVNLEIGSQYCYRIVAVIAGNNSGKLSLDTCLIPKEAEAPVITNVSVEETNELEGKVFVRWTSPFEIDQTQYPPPYKYQVVRKNETLNTPFEKIGGLQSDTTFTDVLLNTSKYSFRYFVELYVPALSTHALDSSSQASSITAQSESKLEQIDIHWDAKVPWSNYSEKHPYHLIFRSRTSDGLFELIDSVNVITDGFTYADLGRYRNMALTRDPYFYRIKTRGTYGNPEIDDPLENWSPTISGQLLDTIPPCTPVVQIESIDCNKFSCDGKSYFTSLQWSSPDLMCDEDVTGYEVLVKSDTAKVYTSLGIVKESTYRHSNLTNLDYCYRVVSIDHFGNRSDSSAVVCNTSCLNFKLPNVITPGTIDDQNDFFVAYDENNSSEDFCGRSVTRIELVVYNRWGEEVFIKEINNQDSNILWPGTNTAGTEVSAGTYFFKAQVGFQTNNPSKRTQEFKGWVHLLR